MRVDYLLRQREGAVQALPLSAALTGRGNWAPRASVLHDRQRVSPSRVVYVGLRLVLRVRGDAGRRGEGAPGAAHRRGCAGEQRWRTACCRFAKGDKRKDGGGGVWQATYLMHAHAWGLRGAWCEVQRRAARRGAGRRPTDETSTELTPHQIAVGGTVGAATGTLAIPFVSEANARISCASRAHAASSGTPNPNTPVHETTAAVSLGSCHVLACTACSGSRLSPCLRPNSDEFRFIALVCSVTEVIRRI